MENIVILQIPFKPLNRCSLFREFESRLNLLIEESAKLNCKCPSMALVLYLSCLYLSMFTNDDNPWEESCLHLHVSSSILTTNSALPFYFHLPYSRRRRRVGGTICSYNSTFNRPPTHLVSVRAEHEPPLVFHSLIIIFRMMDKKKSLDRGDDDGGVK